MGKYPMQETMSWLLVDTLLFNLSQVRDHISDDRYL